MFDRFKLLIGEENFLKLQNKKILVVGIGGVGGECVISLVRSGINSVVIIDNDIVEESNLNRQAVAFISNLGYKKVDVMSNILKDINSNINVVKYDLFLDENNIIDLLDKEEPDYIIDCCDTVNTKKAIIKEAIKRDIKVISSMGTGNKLEPSMLEIDDIRNTINCPLARVMRKWINDSKIKEKVPVLYSKELPKYKGKVVASSSFVPGAAGLLIASYVIKDLLK